MTITTQARVERGTDYYQRYYRRTAEVRRTKARENSKCRYRRGWANWLIAELIAYWYAAEHGASPQSLQLILDSRPTSNLWMRFAFVGRNKRSTGKNDTPIRSIG